MKDVYWTISPFVDVPTVIYDNPVKPEILAKCPVVSHDIKRTRIINAPYHLLISPEYIFSEVSNSYQFNKFNSSSLDVRDEFLWGNYTVNVTGEEAWYDSFKPQFQIVLPYMFICEEPLDMTLLGLQSSETKSKLDDLLFIGATFDINTMARALSSAWCFQKYKDVQAEFMKNQPIMKLHFSDNIRLHKFTPGEKFKHWVNVNGGLTQYNQGTQKLFGRIKSRRPQGLFKEVKDNVEYSEA